MTLVSFNPPAPTVPSSAMNNVTAPSTLPSQQAREMILEGLLREHLSGNPSLNVSPYDAPQFATGENGKSYLFQRCTANGKPAVIILNHSVQNEGGRVTENTGKITIGLDKLDAYLKEYSISPAPVL